MLIALLRRKGIALLSEENLLIALLSEEILLIALLCLLIAKNEAMI